MLCTCIIKNCFLPPLSVPQVTAVPAEGNGNLQTLICVLVARLRRCLTLSNPVPWQNWMVAYLGYTLQMRTLFCGWPVMVHDTHTRRRRRSEVEWVQHHTWHTTGQFGSSLSSQNKILKHTETAGSSYEWTNEPTKINRPTDPTDSQHLNTDLSGSKFSTTLEETVETLCQWSADATSHCKSPQTITINNYTVYMVRQKRTIFEKLQLL